MEEKGRVRRDRRTLSSVVLSAFIGRSVTIELKNDQELNGILDDVDKDMNLTIGRVTGVISEGPHRGLKLPPSEIMFVRGRRIRFISLDSETSVVDQLKQAALLTKKGTKSRHWITDKKRTKFE